MADSMPVCVGDLTFPGGVPVCSGLWRIQPVSVPFDPSQLDPVAVVSAIGNGFIVMGIPLLVILSGKLVLRAIRGKKL